MELDIVVEGLSRRFVRGGRVIEAISKASFKLGRRAFGVVYGPSGSGKSTLMNILAGFDRPTSGRAVVAGVDVSRAGWGELVRLRREVLGYAMQANLVFPKLSVEYNIALPLMLRGTPAGESLERAREVAEELGLGGTLGRPAYTLSGGELRRLVVARALVVEPRILLLDEPTSNMDEDTAKLVWSVVLRRAKRVGSTVLAATHDPLGKGMAETLIEAKNGIIKCVQGCP